MRTTTSSYSQSASATYLSSAVNSNGLSNTTALTRQSNYLTSAVNSAGLSSTTALGNTIYGGYIADPTIGDAYGRIVFAYSQKTSDTSRDTYYATLSSFFLSCGSVTNNLSSVLRIYGSFFANFVGGSSVSTASMNAIQNSSSEWGGGRFTMSSSQYNRLHEYCSASGYWRNRNVATEETKPLYVMTSRVQYVSNTAVNTSGGVYGSVSVLLRQSRKSITLSAADQTAWSELVSTNAIQPNLYSYYNSYQVYDRFSQVSATGYTGYSSKVSTSGYSGISSSSSSESASGTCWE